MKILWLIALLLTSGCSTRANSNYIAQEVRTFYSGMLNGEEISITCEDRDYKTAFFKTKYMVEVANNFNNPLLTLAFVYYLKSAYEN